MKVCVLGATGFIGGHIARAAAGQGWQVCAIRRNPNNTGAIPDVPVEWFTGNLNDVDSLRRAMRDCDVVFHAAAAYPQNFRAIEREVSLARTEMENVLQAARTAHVSRLIYTSSITTIGQPPPGRIADERDAYRAGQVKSAYYEAKHAMERLALRQYGEPDIVVLIPSAVFGPGDIKPTTGIVIREAMRARIPVYFDAAINAVDVRDVAISHINAVTRGKHGERYILGGSNVTLLELLRTTCELAGVAPPRLRLPRGFMHLVVRAADALPFVSLPENFRAFAHWQPVSSTRAVAELGLPTRDLRDTLRDTIAWFREHAATQN